MIEFSKSERNYLEWVESHPSGFVLNVRMKPDSDYVVLHSATCKSISTKCRARGAYTERSYRKWCANSIGELRQAAKTEGRRDGSFSRRCGICRP